MTYPLQFAAGALINTAGSGNDFVGGTNGYGNVQFNGLPSLSNGYIVDGLETNDPLTNLNSGLSTNLVLGLELDRGGDGQHALLRGRSRPVWRCSGQLCHQIRHQPVSREPIRVVERLEIQCGGFLHERDRRKSQAALHGESLRRQSGRPDSPRQAVLLFRFRMGPDRAADRQRHDRADAGISELCPATAAAWWSGLRNRLDLSAGAATRAVLSRSSFRFTATPRALRCRFSAAHSTVMGRLRAAIRPPETVARTARAFRIRVTIASRCRRLASTTTSIRRTWHGSGFSPTPAFRPPILTRSIRYSTPSLRSRSTPSHRATRMCSPGIW